MKLLVLAALLTGRQVFPATSTSWAKVLVLWKGGHRSQGWPDLLNFLSRAPCGPEELPSWGSLKSPYSTFQPSALNWDDSSLKCLPCPPGLRKILSFLSTILPWYKIFPALTFACNLFLVDSFPFLPPHPHQSLGSMKAGIVLFAPLIEWMNEWNQIHWNSNLTSFIHPAFIHSTLMVSELQR